MDEALKGGMLRGISFASIAGDINRKFGILITRNAAIGRASRLGFGAKRKPTRWSTADDRPTFRKQKVKRERKPSPLRVLFGKPISTVPLEPMALPPPVVTDVGRVAFDDLDHNHCRYPVGDGPGVRFCGDSKFPGLSYCEHHARRCYTAPEAKRKPPNAGVANAAWRRIVLAPGGAPVDTRNLEEAV